MSRTIALAVSALLMSTPVAIPLAAQAPSPSTPPHATSAPYTGDLSIFEEPDRDRKLQIDRVMNILHIAPGKTVADIGAGGGWFTVRAARRVGATGHAFGEDINPAAVKAITDRAAKEHLPQVTAVLGTPVDPKLPAHSVDAVLLLKVYHEIADTSAFLRNLRPALAPDARIGIIDRNGNGSNHGLDQATVEREMTAAGFREIEHYDFTKADGQDYFLVFIAR